MPQPGSSTVRMSGTPRRASASCMARMTAGEVKNWLERGALGGCRIPPASATCSALRRWPASRPCNVPVTGSGKMEGRPGRSRRSGRGCLPLLGRGRRMPSPCSFSVRMAARMSWALAFSPLAMAGGVMAGRSDRGAAAGCVCNAVAGNRPAAGASGGGVFFRLRRLRLGVLAGGASKGSRFWPRDAFTRAACDGRMKAIAASSETASFSSGGDAGGKESSSSLRAISRASLAIWLSLPGLACDSSSCHSRLRGWSSARWPSGSASAATSVAAELVVHLRTILDHLEADGLVLHGGFLSCEKEGCRRVARKYPPKRAGTASAVSRKTASVP